MKKFYEAPSVEELYANAPALMSDLILSGGADNAGDDELWNDDLLK